MKNGIKFILEIIPLLVFFVLYKFADMITATLGVIIATLFAQGATYYLERKFSVVQLMATIMLVFFGGITIYSGNTIFIKLKPTIINLLFALILLTGVLRKRGLLKYVFNHTIEMTEANWITFSKRWGLFFLSLAGINELVWRNFPENIWVNFKVFGILGLTILFFLTQISFLSKHNTKH